jgi:hypothetical protein
MENTIKEIIEDMTEEEKKVWDFLGTAKTKDYPNLKEMIDNFWKCYYYNRKSPLDEFGYLNK